MGRLSRVGDAGLLAVQGRGGIGFWPWGDVALLQDEFEGRVAVVFADGSMAHRPGPMGALHVPGVVPVADGVLGNPGHATFRKGTAHFPGGWEYPCAGALTAPQVPAPADPVMPGCRLHASEIVFVQVAAGKVICTTPHGDVAVTVAGRVRDWARRHPHLIRCAWRWFNLTRLRRIERAGDGWRLVLDGGEMTISEIAGKTLARSLGMALDWLHPLSVKHRAMYRLGLQDFPFRLLDASAERLRTLFGDDERSVVANLIWEAFRHRARGDPLDYGTEHRGFYYRPVLAVLDRMGLTDGHAAGARRPTAFGHRRRTALPARDVEALLDALDLHPMSLFDAHYFRYGQILDDMVMRWRLLTFRELGFGDPRPDLRTIGDAHPDVLLLTEKDSLLSQTRTVGKVFGVSTAVLGGMAKAEAIEALADALRPYVGHAELKIVSYGDFDPEGWTIADATVSQLARFGIRGRVVGRLVLPKRFTRRERRLLAEPIVPIGRARQTMLTRWLARSGGVDGEAKRIHADHLLPVARVIAAFRDETGMAPVAAPDAPGPERAPGAGPVAGGPGLTCNIPRTLYLRRDLVRLFWPFDDVAMLTDEGTGRLEAVSAAGEVAHCVAALTSLEAAGPWVRVGPGVLVHPAHARQRGGVLVLPGGWRVAWGGPLPAPEPEAADQAIPGTELRLGDVYGMRGRGPSGGMLLTDHGEVPYPRRRAVALRKKLVRAGDLCLNPRRMRALEPVGKRIIVRMDNGRGFPVSRDCAARVRVRLGLPGRLRDERVTAAQEEMFALGLRDYPFELFEAGAGRLRALFGGDARRLVAHLLWQTVRWRRAGRTLSYGTNTRGYFYRPVLPLLTRAGFAGDTRAAYPLFLSLLDVLIGHWAVFTYADLGIRAVRDGDRGIGEAHPDVVVLCEKISMAPFVRRLAREFGVSFAVMDGQPQLLVTETLVRELRPRARGAVRVVAYVDYDYAGWIIAHAFVGQLVRYGMEAAVVGHVVTPERFSAEELRTLSHPLTARRAEERTKIAAWMKACGGIDGEARGIYSNHLVPYVRVEAAFREVLGGGAGHGR